MSLNLKTMTDWIILSRFEVGVALGPVWSIVSTLLHRCYKSPTALIKFKMMIRSKCNFFLAFVSDSPKYILWIKKCLLQFRVIRTCFFVWAFPGVFSEKERKINVIFPSPLLDMHVSWILMNYSMIETDFCWFCLGIFVRLRMFCQSKVLK